MKALVIMVVALAIATQVSAGPHKTRAEYDKIIIQLKAERTKTSATIPALKKAYDAQKNKLAPLKAAALKKHRFWYYVKGGLRKEKTYYTGNPPKNHSGTVRYVKRADPLAVKKYKAALPAYNAAKKAYLDAKKKVVDLTRKINATYRLRMEAKK
jgi:uncharacterized protein YihD (DUF1040 family)